MEFHNLKDIKVVIADDHPMLLQGLKDTMEKNGIHVVGAAHDGTTALKMILDHQPQLAILDVEMPYLTGFAIAEECKKKALDTKFIILSYHKEPEFIVRARNLNITGYLLKEDTSMEILACIKKVLNNDTYYSAHINDNNLEFANDNLKRLSTLSPSEKKILKMIAIPLSSQEIAEQLHVSERTIEKHRSNIISKLGISGQTFRLSFWAREQKSAIMGL